MKIYIVSYSGGRWDGSYTRIDFCTTYEKLAKEYVNKQNAKLDVLRQIADDRYEDILDTLPIDEEKVLILKETKQGLSPWEMRGWEYEEYDDVQEYPNIKSPLEGYNFLLEDKG